MTNTFRAIQCKNITEQYWAFCHECCS